MRAAIALSLVFVARAGATAMYDYKPGEFLMIEGERRIGRSLSGFV
jgi:hypothetical protein